MTQYAPVCAVHGKSIGLVKECGFGVPENTENVTPAAGEGAQSDSETRFTQDDVNRIVQERLERERKRFEGFEEYKQAAERLVTVEAENKQLSKKVARFEAERERSELVAYIAKETGVPAEALRGDTKEELEAHAEVLRSLISTGPVVPGQELYPETISDDPMREFTRNLFAQAEKE